jgi:hypothetical protein
VFIVYAPNALLNIVSFIVFEDQPFGARHSYTPFPSLSALAELAELAVWYIRLVFFVPQALDQISPHRTNRVSPVSSLTMALRTLCIHTCSCRHPHPSSNNAHPSHNGFLNSLSQRQGLLRLDNLARGGALALGRRDLLLEPQDSLGDALPQRDEDGAGLLYGFLLFFQDSILGQEQVGRRWKREKIGGEAGKGGRGRTSCFSMNSALPSTDSAEAAFRLASSFFTRSDCDVSSLR